MAKQVMKLADIKANPNNPRIIKDDKYQKLVQSLKDFPEMLEARPIVVNPDMIVLGGNMRLKAAKEAGLKEAPVYVATWEEAKQREFIIKDNVGFGEWDWDMLANEWDEVQLDNWGLELPNLSINNTDNVINAHEKLQDKFIVPPFSVLDSRQGYWQERKKYWRTLIGDNGESREHVEAYKNKHWDGKEYGGGGLSDISLLDPVLAELTNHWFGLPNCKAFDCFAGDSVFGYVSAYLGNNFTGIELREEQVKINNNRVIGMPAKYICDDAQNILHHIQPDSQDLLFSCPPYFDLEVYSDMPNDASNQKEYSKFINILTKAFTDSIKCLKDERFAVITVGDIRNKKGFYYRFVDDIKTIFANNNCHLYNEMILVDPIGNAHLRAQVYMKNRKVVKTHQNVLVFYKGNPKNIKTNYPAIDITIDKYDGADV